MSPLVYRYIVLGVCLGILVAGGYTLYAIFDEDDDNDEGGSHDTTPQPTSPFGSNIPQQRPDHPGSPPSPPESEPPVSGPPVVEHAVA